MQPSSLLHGQPTSTGENLRGPRARSKQPCQIALPSLLHPGADGSAGIWRIDRPMPPLVLRDECGEHVESIGPRRAGDRFALEYCSISNSAQSCFGPYRSHIHRHHTVSGSILSYSARVPTDFTNTRVYV
jgi:hypothetical protein